jgi:hypothetical protein
MALLIVICVLSIAAWVFYGDVIAASLACILGGRGKWNS